MNNDEGCIRPTISIPNEYKPNQGQHDSLIGPNAGKYVPPHDKVYEKPLPFFSTYDHERLWICRKCGKEGVDIFKSGRQPTEYEELKLKFKDKS